MDALRRLVFTGWVCVGLRAGAQSATGNTTARPTVSVGWPRKTMVFAGPQALLGFPVVAATREGSSRAFQMRCGSDGTTYVTLPFDVDAAGSDVMPERDSVSPSGEVKALLPGLPVGFAVTAVKDAYVSDRAVVTLVEGALRDVSDGGRASRATQYYLALQERRGSAENALVRLDVHFKPLKVAMFGSGQFLVLGWDEANLIPLIAVVKEDGTVRRFLDMEHSRMARPRRMILDDPLGAAPVAAPLSKAPLEALRDAVFVPYGEKVLMTFPGRTLPLRIVSEAGDDQAVSLMLPDGYVLQEVLVSGTQGPWVVRAELAADLARREKGGKDAPRQRLFEMNYFDGSLERELIVDERHMRAIVCATDNKLTAILEEPLPSSVAEAKGAVAGETAATGAATEWVIVTARR